MSMNRRDFLRTTSVGAAALGLEAMLPRSAKAQTWGELPSGNWPVPVKVLEIFCYSGMSQWETFWLMEGAGNTRNWLDFETDVANLSWHCTGGPASSTDSKLFGSDAGGTNVYWGPATTPLWRSDIFSRARMLAMSHDQPAHALAIPLTLTGHKLGNPRSAGLGAAVQHQQMSKAPRTLPYSYVIAPDDIAWEFTVGAATASGFHPGYAQPLVIRIGDPSFLAQLQRTQATAASDELLRTYQAMEADRLRYQGHDLVRSTGFSSYSGSLNSVFNAPSLYTQLQAVNLVVPPTLPCASAPPIGSPVPTPSNALPASLNRAKTELDLATFLLTSGGADYVCVIDRGPDRESGGTPYDLHFDTDTDPFARILSNNVYNLCSLLAERIASNDPTRINLDDTLIVIHSEFGRTPYRDMVPQGRNHWPYGYAAILIGGPIPQATQSTSVIVGGIDAQGHALGLPGTTPKPYSPIDLRGAVMLAAGIDPMAQENFGVGDFTPLITATTSTGKSGEDAIRENLKTRILGV